MTSMSIPYAMSGDRAFSAIHPWRGTNYTSTAEIAVVIRILARHNLAGFTILHA